MRLGLSSAAAPDAPLDALLAACVRRGLGVLELREGDAHGLRADRDPSDGVIMRTYAVEAGVTIAAYRASSCDDPARLARIAEALGAPVVVAADASLHQRIACARSIIASGGSALVAVTGPATQWLPLIEQQGVNFAWDADGGAADLAADAALVLRALPLLGGIRFIGGGPETAMQGGQGVGTLIGRLALAAYDGPLVLAPSDVRYRVAWASWLGRTGGLGCGSKASQATVQLPVMAGGGS